MRATLTSHTEGESLGQAQAVRKEMEQDIWEMNHERQSGRKRKEEKEGC